MVVEILRIETTLHYGTFGVLTLDDVAFCATLEPPNFGNMRNMSCIPTGQYRAARIMSPKFGETFEIRHVPNRSGIIFHAGNVVANTEGCVLVAQYWGKLRGDRAVLNSGATFQRLLAELRTLDEFSLTIREVY